MNSISFDKEPATPNHCRLVAELCEREEAARERGGLIRQLKRPDFMDRALRVVVELATQQP